MRPLILAAFLVGACSSGAKTDADYKQQITTGMHDTLLADLKNLHQAALDIQSAAPTHAWDKTADAAAITSMKNAWIRARTSYELIEGAIAPLFPETDFAIDARYDDFLTERAGKDYDPFGADVTGMHAVERIVWANEIPSFVVEFEKTIPGYKPAAYPSTADEAMRFKNVLCAKLASDTQLLVDQWTPQKIDLSGAYDGLVHLMMEQREKVNKASTSEEESRYSQRTMADIRDNLAGTKKVYALFSPYITSKNPMLDQRVTSGFASLDSLYGSVSGDAIPRPPATWSAEMPSEADLQTPFGKLWRQVRDAADPTRTDSVVSSMTQAAKTIGFAVSQ